MAEISKVTINNTDYLLKSVSTQGIPYGDVTSNSTTVFTATVPGITELRQGTCCLIRNNNKQTSASGWTLNVNDLGAKPVYNNMADASRETTIFNKVYTMLFVYDEDRVSGGCWICYKGYDSNTNTIGYQLRTNFTVMNVSDTARYYKLYFMSADNTKWVPASVNSTNNATAARPVNQRPINPFGRIVYTSANTNYTAGSNLAAATIWDQYALSLGYSFNRTGAALTMTVEAPVYVKCAPQADGSAIMDATTPIVQALPSTADGKIYIYLGVAYSAVNIELVPHHPVYYHDGTAIRLWTGASGGSSSVAWNDITGKPTFATVATSGSYNDLSDKPTTSSNQHFYAISYSDGSSRDIIVHPSTAIPDSIGIIISVLFTNSFIGPFQNYSLDVQDSSASSIMNDSICIGGTWASTINPLKWCAGEVLTFMRNREDSLNTHFELIARSVSLPVVTSADDGKVLTVVNGEWAAVSQTAGYAITYESNPNLQTINTAGITDSSGGFANQAEEGDTVTVVISRPWDVYVTNETTSSSVSCTKISNAVWNFVMPASDVSIAFVYND